MGRQKPREIDHLQTLTIQYGLSLLFTSTSRRLVTGGTKGRETSIASALGWKRVYNTAIYRRSPFPSLSFFLSLSLPFPLSLPSRLVHTYVKTSFFILSRSYTMAWKVNSCRMGEMGSNPLQGEKHHKYIYLVPCFYGNRYSGASFITAVSPYHW